MKTYTIKLGSLSHCLLLLGVIFLLGLISMPVTVYSQLDRQNIRRIAQPVVRDTITPVMIRVRENNETRVVESPISSFHLSPEAQSAIVADGIQPRPYESQGKVFLEGRERSLLGMALPELHIAKVVGAELAVKYNVLIDTLPQLIHNREMQSYEGFFGITLVEETGGILQNKVLTEPVLIEISSGSGAILEPRAAMIDHINLPSTMVRIVDNSAQDPVPIRIITDFNPSGYITYLKKEALLRIETPPRDIQGLGVQTIPITVSVPRRSEGEPVHVRFSTTKGTIEPAEIVMSDGGSAHATLRSEGIGAAVVTVNADGFQSQSQEFGFVFPWLFLLFSVVGGFLGAVVNHLMRKGPKKLSSAFILGIIAGFIVAVLYYVIGLQIFTISLENLYNEFAVLGLAFLGALFWNSIYKSLSKLVA